MRTILFALFAVILASAFLAAMCGCTDAERSTFAAYGTAHRVQLYSGGQLVGEWQSTGKVLCETNSDGYKFCDASTQKLVRVSGVLVITPIE